MESQYTKPINSLLSDKEWNEFVSLFGKYNKKGIRICSKEDISPDGKIYKWISKKKSKYTDIGSSPKRCLLCGDHDLISSKLGICHNCYTSTFIRHAIRSQQIINWVSYPVLSKRTKTTYLAPGEWNELTNMFPAEENGCCHQGDNLPGGQVYTWFENKAKKYQYVTAKRYCFLCGDVLEAGNDGPLCHGCHVSFIENGVFRPRAELKGVEKKFPQKLLCYIKPENSFLCNEEWDTLISFYNKEGGLCGVEDVASDGKVSIFLAKMREKYPSAKEQKRCFVCGEPYHAERSKTRGMCIRCYQMFISYRKIRSQEIIRNVSSSSRTEETPIPPKKPLEKTMPQWIIRKDMGFGIK